MREVDGWRHGAPFAGVPTVRWIDTAQFGELTTGAPPPPQGDDLSFFVHALFFPLIVPRLALRRSSLVRRAAEQIDDPCRDVIDQRSGAGHKRDRNESNPIDDRLDLRRALPPLLPDTGIRCRASIFPESAQTKGEPRNGLRAGRCRQVREPPRQSRYLPRRHGAHHST